MPLKLWIDDLRWPPPGYHWAWSYDDAISFLTTYDTDEVSFDNDLGEKLEGYDIAKWIEERAASGLIKRLKWHVHSANPCGRKNIEAAMKSAERFWDKNESLV